MMSWASPTPLIHTVPVIMIQSVRLLRDRTPASNIGAERDWGAPGPLTHSRNTPAPKVVVLGALRFLRYLLFKLIARRAPNNLLY
jgi:hypothetical protein